MSLARARKLRKDSTWAERRLWRLLRCRRLAGYKFRRQYHEGRYYLDFFCFEAKLAVELDGSGHGFPAQQQHDAQRDAFFAARGIMTKRIWNHQLAKADDRQNIVENLWRLLQKRLPHPENVALPPARREPDKPSL
jgi:very-short-patch-repair endonuclease